MGAATEPSGGRPEPPRPKPDGAQPACAAHLRVLRRMILGLLIVLLVGIGYRQVFRSDDYAARERRQNTRRIMLPGPRGVIYDREHRVLAGNRDRISATILLGDLRAEFYREEEILARLFHPQNDNGPHSVYWSRSAPAAVDERTTARAPWLHEISGLAGGGGRTGDAVRARYVVMQRHLDRINAITGRKEQIDAARLERAFARERMTPCVLADNLSADESARLGAALDATDPMQLIRSSRRWYPHGSVASHVLGALRRELVRTPVGPDFPILNYFGTTGDFGIEKQYDARLQGRPGSEVIRVDAFGFRVGPALAREEPSAGEDVVLSLDWDLQLAAERAMAATVGLKRGAAVAIAVATGEVLAMASKPDFDLNAVLPGYSSATKRRIDAEGAWFDGAFQGLYPPGSTFKLFTVMAGLRRGTLHPEAMVRCDGYLDVAGHRFPCHNPAGHGDLTLREALAHSCNVYAWRAGLAAGAEALAAEARRFHFAEPTGIDLPFETRGILVPDPAAAADGENGSWTPIDTANLSIGQGVLRVSPLQAACAIASLARRETLTVPTLLYQPGRRPGGERPPEPMGLADADFAALVEGMEAVVRTGIGQDAQVPGVAIAGKSGTAQVMRKEGMMNVAWFVAFAPVAEPRIAIAVALEGAQPGEEFAGARHAAPVVREIIAAYFDKPSRR